jgi:hypothetical protein
MRSIADQIDPAAPKACGDVGAQLPLLGGKYLRLD